MLIYEPINAGGPNGEMAGILAGLLLIYWRVRYPPQSAPPSLSNMCRHILNLSHSNNNNNNSSDKKQAKAGLGNNYATA